jgi:hypothetical protein
MGIARRVGLLTVPVSLVREPLRVTLRAWHFGLSTAAEGARIASELLDPDRGEAEPDFAHRSPEPPPVAAEPPPVVAEPPPVVADAPPAVPDELIPDHVDEEPVLVAEVAEGGAEDGAGPELHVDQPWDGYDGMTVGEIRDRLAAASTTEAGAVELYEVTHRNRRSVLDAAERAQRAQPL